MSEYQEIKYLAGAIKVAGKVINNELEWATVGEFDPGKVLQALALLKQKINEAYDSLIICLPAESDYQYPCKKVVDTVPGYGRVET